MPGAVNVSAAPDALQLRVVDFETLQPKSQVGAKQAFSVEVTDSAGAPVPNAAVTCRLPDTGASGTFADGTHATVAYTDASGRATLEPVQWGPVSGDVPLRLTATKGTVHTAILVQTALADASPVSHASAGDTSTPRESAMAIAPLANASEASPSTPPTITQPVVSVTEPAAKSAQEPGQVAARVAVLNPAPDKLTPSIEPSVSVSRTSAADAPHGSHAKWYVLALVGVAAGAGAAMAMRGHSSSTTTNTSAASVAIGTPTVSVGH